MSGDPEHGRGRLDEHPGLVAVARREVEGPAAGGGRERVGRRVGRQRRGVAPHRRTGEAEGGVDALLRGEQPDEQRAARRRAGRPQPGRQLDDDGEGGEHREPGEHGPGPSSSPRQQPGEEGPGGDGGADDEQRDELARVAVGDVAVEEDAAGHRGRPEQGRAEHPQGVPVAAQQQQRCREEGEHGEQGRGGGDAGRAVRLVEHHPVGLHGRCLGRQPHPREPGGEPQARRGRGRPRSSRGRTGPR